MSDKLTHGGARLETPSGLQPAALAMMATHADRKLNGGRPLSGKVVLVTGANSGLGKQAADFLV